MNAPTRKPTPRPTFDVPTVITDESAVFHVWGDELSGLVHDKVIVSSQEIHVLEFTIPAGSHFVQSPTNPTVFDADVVYLVIAGSLWLRDASSGHTLQVQQGDLTWIKPRTWHQAFNPYSEDARVLEFFSPPPARGTASVFAQKQPYLNATATIFSAENPWPPPSPEMLPETGLVTLPRSDWRWSFGESQASTRIGTALQTQDLRVDFIEIDLGHFWEINETQADTAVRAETRLSIHSVYAETDFNHVIEPGESLFLPRGSSLRVEPLPETSSDISRLWVARGSSDD